MPQADSMPGEDLLVLVNMNVQGSVCLTRGSQVLVVAGGGQKMEDFGSLGCLIGHCSEKSSLWFQPRLGVSVRRAPGKVVTPLQRGAMCYQSAEQSHPPGQ